MYSTLLIIQALSILVLFVEILYVFSKMKTDIHKYLLINFIATFVNNIGYFIEMVSESEEEYLRGLQVSYIGKVWIVYSLFIFLMLVCHKKVNSITRMVLVTIHSVVFCLVALCEYIPLYYKSFTYVTEDVLFPYLKNEGGIAHVLYDLLIMVYILVGLSHLVLHIRQTKNSIDQKRLIFILFAVLANVIGYFVHLFADIGGYDSTNLGFAVGTVFMAIAIFKYNLMDTLQLVKDYVIDELPEAIIAVNDAGTVDYSNDTSVQLMIELGKDENEALEVIRKHASEKKPIEIGGKIYDPKETLLEDENVAHGEVYVLVDETEHYNYQRELSLQKEIAEKANESKSRFLSIMSHEIRTPMNAVVSMTELLLRESEKLDDTQKKYLKNMKNSGESLVRLVNDILDQSKIEAGKMVIVEDAYIIRDTVSDVKTLIENSLGKKKIEIITYISEEVPDILYGDALRIRQIIINLMNNAVKYTENGYVKLSILVTEKSKNNYKLKFSIEDSGQGIRKEDLEKIGEEFSQFDVKNNHFKEGTGLGLSISKELISLMGGSLKVKSEYGKGSEFYFEISQGIKEADSDMYSNSSLKKASAKENDYAGKKVLVVDDTEINLVIADALLSKLNIQVDTATLGADAIELVKNNRYDVIFMDYLMPRMNGIETTSKIRQLSEVYASNDGEKANYLRNVKIIALTADDSDETKKKFEKAGVSGFTDKPIDVGKILKWLK